MHLGLAELTVLAVICERPMHGFAVAKLTAREAPLGRVWHIPRPVVYRALGRLVDAGLVVEDAVEAGQGPQRVRYGATVDGTARAATWLDTPVAHVREIRSELLMKLALLDRREVPTTDLLARQARILDEIVAGLAADPSMAGFDGVLHAWRLSSAQAARRFVGDVAGELADAARC